MNHAIIGLHPRQIEDAPDLAQRFASDYLAELQAE